ncbi:hypothetical protein VPH35_012381 [Triticum aestivum]
MVQLLVSSSTGAMGFVLGKLGTMLSDEYKLLKGVHDDIKFLKDELEAMQAFLLMMADVEKPDQQATVRANAVREMSYEIEDTIDKFMLLGGSDDSISMFDCFGKVCKKIMKKIADIKTCHKIAKDIHDIKTQVKEISKRYARYMVNEPSRSKNENFDPRIRAIYKDASDLIGVDGSRDEIFKWLCNRDGESTPQLKVVSIVGYGGLGKKTLARQVYDKLRTNYDCRIFSSILSQLRNQEFAHAGDLHLTIELIRTFLQHKRYFIIIDDVWDIHTWQGLNCALFRNDRGSVIMTTTRIYDVAKSCCLSYGDHLVYKIQPLCVPDSKKLFFKRIFGCEEECPSNLKQVSQDILKKCGGLPLAINTISSLLASGKRKKSGTHSDINTMNYILSLSYYDLPLCLRSFLLYLTMFPEDYDIGMERLVHRWVSEGFIHGEDGKDLFEIGETYFLELVNRSLIQPIHISYDGAFSCRVHDTILDFLIYKSTKENFCMLLSNHSKSVSRVRRRLSLMGNEDQESVEKLDLSHVRSLGSFGYHLEYLPSLAKLNALRVLDLRNCNGLRNHHLKYIRRLFQLRYLNISLTNITQLPIEIGDLEYLETLDASGAELNELPESVTRLRRLTRLFVPKQTKLPDAVGNMENLREFGYSINTFMQSVKFLEELGKLTNLRKLSIQWDTRELEETSCKGEKLVSSLCKMDECKLRNLHILLYLREGDGLVGHPSIPALNSIRSITLGCGRISWIAQWLI